MNKKLLTVFIEFLILFNLAFCLYIDILYIKAWIAGIHILNVTCLLSLLGTATCIVAIILIAIKDFPVFKPLVDKLNARKEKHAQAKAERAEEAKQAKIQALEEELNQLKNN